MGSISGENTEEATEQICDVHGRIMCPGRLALSVGPELEYTRRVYPGSPSHMEEEVKTQIGPLKSTYNFMDLDVSWAHGQQEMTSNTKTRPIRTVAQTDQTPAILDRLRPF